jgi:hypothetical protein
VVHGVATSQVKQLRKDLPVSAKKQVPQYVIQDVHIDMNGVSNRSKTQYELALAMKALAESLKIPNNSYGIYIDAGKAPEVGKNVSK